MTSGTESLPPYLFFTCWAILAVGIGLLLGLRWEMLNAHMRYEAEHGFPLWRPLAKLQWAIWERQQAATVKGFPRFIGGLFVLIGTCILAYVLLNHETTLTALAREWAGSFTAVRILIGLS